LSVLRDCDPRLDDVEFWTGMDRRQVEPAAERLEKAASLIDSLNAQPFRAVLAGVTGWGRAPFFELPATMRSYASQLRDVLSNVSGRKHQHRDFQLAALVQYVEQCTGTWHDAEVATVTAAVLDKDPSPQTHAQWRRENYDRLIEIRQKTRSLTDALDRSPVNGMNQDS
jgi:hypothetical protein